ncbi:MAG: MgtC/SapB family protein, partial [Acutalibacteraceae bacterium]|nr:MgtC/SapB family protein [Acutalibacteraceae bacterium]
MDFSWLYIDLDFTLKVLVRLLLAVIIGVLIGSERARHGRAAGMRTHIIVCLGSALTSMISIFVSDITGNGGDVLRISAQVIS